MANALNQLKAMNKKDNYAIGSVSNQGGGGSGGGVMVVTIALAEDGAKNGVTKASGGGSTTLIADKTVAEIKAAALSGGVVFVDPDSFTGESNRIFALTYIEFSEKDNAWYIAYFSGSGKIELSAESLQDYPRCEL